MEKNTTPVVDEISQLHLEGNVIPHSWYKNVTLDNGKPDLNAIVILADIVYWYRPTIIRDESTGEVVKTTKRFHANKLQRSYQQIADFFGLSKGQAADACYRLKDRGLITTELRTVATSLGTMSNVMFIEPVVEKIKEITFRLEKKLVYQPKAIAIATEGGTIMPQKAIAYATEGGTYTEINPEITPEISTTESVAEKTTAGGAATDSSFAVAMNAWRKIKGMSVNAMDGDNIGELCDSYGGQNVADAMMEANRASPTGQHKLNYIEAILRRWKTEGKGKMQSSPQSFMMKNL
jgi:hypothetical protein